MINKQTLKIKEKEDDKIVRATPYDLSYLDEDFFVKFMGEDKNNDKYLTYAVEVFAMRADWIVNEEKGLLFLQELLK